MQFEKIDAQVLVRETARKLLHLLIAFIPPLALHSRTLAVLLLCTGSLYYLSCESVRLKYRGGSPFLLKSTELVRRITVYSARRQEADTFVISPLTLAAGAVASLYLFEGDVMRIAVYALAFGDSAAAVVGSAFPILRLGFGNKTVGGALGCFAAVAAATFMVAGDLRTSAVCAAAAMLIESVPLREYDNFFLPVGVGAVASLLI